jgi:predicted ATP-grasp superfamily ATP-dependent carboligase
LPSSAEAQAWAESVNQTALDNGAAPAIIAGASITGLAFVRSLGRRGVPVFSLDHRPWEVGMLSRYSRPHALPNPAKNPEAWPGFLLEAAEALECKPVLIPTGDPHLRALAPLAESLGQSYSCALPPDGVFGALVDKRSQYRLLAAAGAPLPSAALPTTEAEAACAATQIGLPCIVKPGFGDLWTPRAGQKLVEARTSEDLLSAYRAMSAAGVGALIQELIPGGDDAFYGCICHFSAAGELLACFTKRKLRQYPPRFGNGSYQTSVACPEAAETSIRLLRGMGYRGTAAIEYKLDPRDGRLKLIEINCRAVSGTQLAIDAGVDLPWIVYRDCIGQPLPPATDFAVGRKLVNLSWDARSYLKAGDHSPVGAARWLKSVLQADSDSLFSWRDPGPSIRTLSRVWRRRNRLSQGT